MLFRVLSYFAKSLFILSFVLYPLSTNSWYSTTDRTYGVCSATSNVGEVEYTPHQVFPTTPNFGTRQYTTGTVWAHLFNDMGDINSGWYDITVDLNGDISEKAEYYSHGVYDTHSDSEYYPGQRPDEVPGNGMSNSYIYGVGCSASDYDSENFGDD